MKFISKYFKFDENKTDFKTEFVGGITTFLTMVYVLFVIPDILSEVGMPKESVFVATALAAAIGTFIMGSIAKFLVVLAPGLGLNAFFTYSNYRTYYGRN